MAEQLHRQPLRTGHNRRPRVWQDHVLGRVATLSDPDLAPSVPRNGLPAGFTDRRGMLADAIYARTMTSGQVRGRIAAAVGLRAETTRELIDGLVARSPVRQWFSSMPSTKPPTRPS